MAKSSEAFFWSLFSAGGVAAALFIPAIILSTGFLLPTNDPEDALARAQKVHGVVAHPITKIVLAGVIGLAFFHCAHRIQHTAKDLGLRPVGGPLAAACYLLALAGTIAAAVVLWRV